MHRVVSLVYSAMFLEFSPPPPPSLSIAFSLSYHNFSMNIFASVIFSRK